MDNYKNNLKRASALLGAMLYLGSVSVLPRGNSKQSSKPESNTTIEEMQDGVSSDLRRQLMANNITKNALQEVAKANLQKLPKEDVYTQELPKEDVDRIQVSNEENLDVEDIATMIDKCPYYNDRVKGFIKDFMNHSSEYFKFEDIASGDMKLLGSMIECANAHVPMPFSNEYITKPSYSANDVQFFDNRDGIIEELPSVIIQVVRSNTYDKYQVYEWMKAERKSFVVTDKYNRLIAYVYDGDFKELDGTNLYLSPANSILKNYRLSSLSRDVYSENDLENIQIAISKVLSDYKEKDNMNMDDLKILDTTKNDSYHDEAPYYFLEFMANDAYNPEYTFYRDLFNPNAVVKINTKNNSFTYKDINVYSAIPFYFEGWDAAMQSLLPLREFLERNGLTDLVPNDKVSYSELNALITYLNESNRKLN